MPKLIHADIWRDGGSLSATVLDGPFHRSFWLQTNHWNHPRDAGHLNLFVSEGNNPQLQQLRVEIASAEERQWLKYLMQVDATTAQKDETERFQELINVLQARHPS